MSHPMVRRSDRNPRAEAIGDNSSSNELSAPLQSVASHPSAMESVSESSATITESPELSDEMSHSTESVTASPPLGNRSPGAGLELDVVAGPFPPPEASEVEPDRDLESINTLRSTSDSGPSNCR